MVHHFQSERPSTGFRRPSTGERASIYRSGRPYPVIGAHLGDEKAERGPPIPEPASVNRISGVYLHKFGRPSTRSSMNRSGCLYPGYTL